jgi:FixJ family two-component response regulator
LTGHFDSELMDRAIEYGPVSVLKKPIECDQLLDMIRQVLPS